MNNDDLGDLISRIGKSKKIENAFNLFAENASKLKDYTFIFSVSKGVIPGNSINRKFSHNSAIRNLFEFDNVLFLDEYTVPYFKWNEKADISLDYSISLDNNVIRNINSFFKGSTSRLPRDFIEVFNFISQDHVNLDPNPYVFENLNKLAIPGISDKVLETFKNFEIFKTIDIECYKNGMIKSHLSEIEIGNKSQEYLLFMIELSNNKDYMFFINSDFKTNYILLLAMIFIKFRLPEFSVLEKTIRFLEFCDTELCMIAERESIIARSYFEKEHNLSFFDDVQLNKPDMLGVIKRMAWDLFHLRFLEKYFIFDINPQARYFIPALLTFDKKLIEIIDLYPLKSIAYIKNKNVFPFYAKDFLETISENKYEQRGIYDKFYSPEPRLRRQILRDKKRNNYDNIISELECEIKKIFR